MSGRQEFASSFDWNGTAVVAQPATLFKKRSFMRSPLSPSRVEHLHSLDDQSWEEVNTGIPSTNTYGETIKTEVYSAVLTKNSSHRRDSPTLDDGFLVVMPKVVQKRTRLLAMMRVLGRPSPRRKRAGSSFSEGFF